MVHVCWSSRSADVSPVEWLDETERGRFDGFPHVEDRRVFLTSRMLLKTVVGHLAETSPERVRLSYHCPGCGRSHGRPIVVAPHSAARWHVSISHTGRHVMVAATDAGPVGVDVERYAATVFEGFDEVALTPVERTEVEHCPPAARDWARATYWARKEAVLKATGYGMNVDPAALEVSAPHRPAALTAWHAGGSLPPQMQITDILMDQDHAAAVAVMAPCPVELLWAPGSGSGQVWERHPVQPPS